MTAIANKHNSGTLLRSFSSFIWLQKKLQL